MLVNVACELETGQGWLKLNFIFETKTETLKTKEKCY